MKVLFKLKMSSDSLSFTYKIQSISNRKPKLSPQSYSSHSSTSLLLPSLVEAATLSLRESHFNSFFISSLILRESILDMLLPVVPLK